MTSKPDPSSGRTDTVHVDSRGVDALVSVSQMVAGTLDRDAVIESAMDAAAEAMNAEACSILLRDAETGELCFYIVKGERTDGLGAARICVDDKSIAGWVASHRKPLLIPDAYDDPRFNPAWDRKTGFHTRSVICVPLVARDRELGVMQVLNRRDGESFDAADLELSQAVASLIAVAIHNAEEHAARVQAERVAVVGQTIAGLAHCIKNILNGLQGGSYILDQHLEKGDRERALRGWGMVKRNMGLLSDIVLDMLSYSKSRKPALKPTPVNRVCEDVVALLEGQAKDAGVSVSTRLGDDIDEVDLDEAAVKRSLINLVGNAVDACREKQGTVTVETALVDGGDRFTLTVRDTGCGIPPAALEKIFNPFFSTKGNKGTGLGLAVTKKIVEEHAGTLEVESTPGKGTAFIIELP
ncbi:MAG TPA: GAF domain-containing sensor histidine kinase, partial [Planctomycetota bacterium]|nr:GAF domain-containing sensor histidine kinase [Planctomycetota bacterium]